MHRPPFKTIIVEMYPFPECTSIAVSGATISGKSFWTYRLLREKDNMFTCPREKVLYCYGIYQSLFGTMEKELPFVTFHQGLPNEDTLKVFSSPSSCNLVILDDLMTQVTKLSEMESFFVKGVHYLHLSLLYINQSKSWFNFWVSFAPEFQCCYFCESSCLFYLSFNFDFCFSKIMHL